MKKSLFKYLTLGFACLLGVGGSIAAASAFNVDEPFEEARADDAIQYISRSWDDVNKVVVSTSSTCETYTTVTSGTTSWIDGGWYVVSSDATIASRVTVSGTANLILCDGATLTAPKGINVSVGNSLNIFDQTNGTGSIIATSNTSDVSGIGGGYNGTGGTVNILGGTVTATGTGRDGAGIGGGLYGAGGNVTVYGGNIIATGSSEAAGIGGGYGRAGGTVNILGGTVTATGGSSAAGIGGGYNGAHGSLTINETNLGVFGDGTANPTTIRTDYASTRWQYMIVKSKPVDYISRSWDSTNKVVVETPNTCDFYKLVKSDLTSWENGKWYVLNESIEINNHIEVSGTVNLILCDDATLTVNSYIVVNSGNTLNIYSQSGGTGALVVTGDEETSAAGIGGKDNDCGTINIYGGNITANGGYAAGIGGGGYEGNGGNVTVYGGNITANGGICSAGIGSCEKGTGGEVIIYGGTVTATGGTRGAGIGSGENGAGGGTVNILGGTVTATGKYGSAGIGGGYGGTGGIVNISGGTVVARGGQDGAGIGGGTGKDGGTVTISGGKVTASAGSTNASGIGKGQNGSDGTLTVNNDGLAVFGDNNTNPPTTIRTNTEYETTRWKYMAVKVPHVHNWSYSADGATITASCSNPECPVTEGLTLELQAPTNLTYDGNAKAATLKAGYNAEAFPNPTIKYYQGTAEVTSCVNAGAYTAKVTFSTATAVLEFTIAQATPTPEVPTGLVATYGDTLSSVTLPSGWSWKVPTDEVGSVGDRTHVAIYTPTDSNYKAIEANIIISVSQATPTPEVPTGLEATYGDKLSNVALPTNWAWKNPEDSVGNAGNREHIAIYTPTDPNYKAVEKTITVSVSQATPTPEVPTGLVATYGDTLSSVALPTNWAWKNPEDSVGNAGNREHIAIYTPTDTDNYNTVEQNVNVVVAKANPEYTVPTGSTTLVNKTLSTITLPAGWTWDDPTQNVGSEPGNKVFKGTFTPEDTTNYNIIEHVDITVLVTEHEHNWAYTASGATITASCGNPECPVTEGLTLELEAPTNLTYSGIAKEATLKTGYSSVAFPSPSIKYYQGTAEITSCVNAGAYTAKVTFGTATAEVEFTIVKANPSTDAVPDQNAVYGQTLSEIALPEGWAWNTPTDKVGNSGTNQHKATFTPEDTNNYNTLEQDVNVIVAKTNPDYTVPTGLEVLHDKTLSDVVLPTGWSWDDPTQNVGSEPGNKVFKATFIPVDTDNYNIVEHVDITVQVTEQDLNEVQTLVENLGNITIEDEETIEAAREAYEALTDEQKEMFPVETLELLENSEKAFDTISKINDIGEIDNSEATKEAIEEAKAVYDALTDEQKELLDEDYVKTLLNSVAVQETIDVINEIGDVVKYDADSKEAIEAAREAYDALTDEQKEMFPTDTLKDIENSEKVYDVLDKIYNIGDVDYDTASEEKINEAVAAYEALTEEQKTMVDKEAISRLKNSQQSYQSKRDAGNAVSISLLAVSSVALVGGLVLLFFLLKGFKKKNGGVKMNSFGLGFSVLVVLASHYADPQFIALYVIAGLALAVWIAVLVVFLKKRQMKKATPVEEAEVASVKEQKAVREEKVAAEQAVVAEQKPSVKQEAVKEAKPVAQETIQPVEENNEDEEEVVTVKDEKGNIFQIRFVKSFTAKLIQSPEETKKYYEELKNEALSYKKANSRISWHFDSVNVGRNQVLKFAIRGKTLCVYLSLNADDYADSKYKVEKVESKKFIDVPCLYRIKNDRRCEYAKELIKVIMDRLGLEKGEEQHENYSNLPYEENAPLIKRGLIKELKVQVNKPEEPVILETKVNSDGDEIVTTKDSKGNIFEIRYIKSFTAKLSQSDDKVKNYYNVLKNYALSFKKANSRVSWHFDSINVGRNQVIKFAIRGKTLCLYYALNADEYVDSKYKVEKVESKKYEDVPCLYRIKNDRRCEYAKELIDAVMSKFLVEKGKDSNEDFSIPFESTKALLNKGLIKEVKTKVEAKEIAPIESVTVEKADKLMSDENAEAAIEIHTVFKHREGKKEIINIDVLSENYKNGEEVTLDSLIKKGLVPSKTGYVKVLARGTLNKKLIVDLDDYSLQAVKMIVLLGGEVKKIK